MLPEIKNRILDGAMGIGGADSTGRFAAIGVSASSSGSILAFTDASDADEALGDGPLRDLVVSALSVSKATVYAIALEGTTPGVCTPVVPGTENVGTGTVTASGTPRNAYDISVEILSSGTLNVATFRTVVDGKAGARQTMPAGNGQYQIPGTGVTITFAPGAGAFVAGNTYSLLNGLPWQARRPRRSGPRWQLRLKALPKTINIYS